MTPAAPGTSGRRRFRRGVAVPTTCTSATEGSARRTTLAVGTVFSCVASRNRERTLGTRKPEFALQKNAAPGPGLPPPRQRYIVCRRLRRVHLVVDDSDGEWLCPLLELQLQLARSAEQQLPCVRFSVALPPGTPTGCLTGVFSAEFKPGLPAKKIRKGSEADEMRMEQNER